MSTKNQVKQKKGNEPIKLTEEENEIIEIGEITDLKKAKNSRKHKENTENSSSEATTPNKKRKNKKRNDAELIEIMDVELPDDQTISEKKKISAPAQRKKKGSKTIEIENVKKNEKSVKSVIKINGKDKSPFKKKKKIRVASITLEESDNDIEMQEITEIKSSSINKKITSKTPIKTLGYNNKEKCSFQKNKNKKSEKKTKKNEKQGKKEKEEIPQCQLSSEESENENMKGSNSKEKIQKNKKEKMKESNSNTGYFTSRKTSKKDVIKTSDENPKSKSIRKVDGKEKVNNLLGRKRKADNKKEKSKTPYKNTNKPRNLKEKSPTKTSAKIKAGKAKSITPNRKSKEKKDNYSNLFIPKMEDNIQNIKEKCSTPELAILNQLIIEYGLQKVIDTLCKPKLDVKNKLDSCLQGLKDSCTKDKLPFFLVKLVFSYFESKFDDKDKIKEIKRSTSTKRTTSLKNLDDIEKIEISTSKFPTSKEKNDFSLAQNIEENAPIAINEDEIEEIKENNEKIEKIEKKKNSKENNNNNEKKPPQVETKKVEKKVTSIGSHYNKTKDGEVFKYQVFNLDGKGNAIFKCYDENCCGTGIYNLESKKFSVNKNHNLKHEEHDYIINMEKDGDNAFKDLKNCDKFDAQVFKENGERTVKIY